ALALDVAGVHHTLGHLLVGTESARLLEHLVHQRGLAVVDVGDDRNVAKIFSYHIPYSTPYYFESIHVTFHCGAGAGRRYSAKTVRAGKTRIRNNHTSQHPACQESQNSFFCVILYYISLRG